MTELICNNSTEKCRIELCPHAIPHNQVVRCDEPAKCLLMGIVVQCVIISEA